MSISIKIYLIFHVILVFQSIKPANKYSHVLQKSIQNNIHYYKLMYFIYQPPNLLDILVCKPLTPTTVSYSTSGYILKPLVN